MAYKTIYKRTKKKPSSKGSGLWLIIAWIFSCAFFLWLTWVLWVGTVNGPLGETVSNALYKFFGQAAVFLPLFLLYWLWRSVKYRTLAVLTLLFGTFLTLVGIGAEAALLKDIFTKSALSGGAAGGWLFGVMKSVSGRAGAALAGFVSVFIGAHILFNIAWVATVRKTIEIIRDDFVSWMSARAQFKAQVKEAKEELKAKNEKFEKENKPAPRRVVERGQDEEEDIEERGKPLPKISRPVAGQIKLPPRIETGRSVQQRELFPDMAVAQALDPQAAHKQRIDFILPPISLLDEPEAVNGVIGPTDEEIALATRLLEDTLKSFDIQASVTGVAPGPVVTRYEIKPDAGVKISSIVSLSNDIALAMKARGIRVEAPIPGKDAIGFEIPNEKPLTVLIREILQDNSFLNSKAKTTVALGRYADGLPATAVITRMPHLLIAGATNSGKSICVHSLINSILYRAKPDEVKFLLIDPKRVELTLYEGIPHLYDPKTYCEDVAVVKDSAGAVKSLQALVKVMEKRMKIFEIAKVKNLESYNAWAVKHGEEKLFYVIVVIDELADLMLQTKAAIEDSVQRLTQMGRAMGIHLILCTQRPSTNVVTGVIKANLPSRIAFQVTSKVDSRVVLDANGADALLGKGDMLYLGISDAKPKRIQGTYISEEEITRVTDFLRAQGGPDYPFQLPLEIKADGEEPSEGLGTTPEEMIKALTLILERRRVSQDLLKSHFGSSARATNILSVLEMKGFISKPEGSNRWEIHFDLIEQQLQTLKEKQGSPEDDGGNDYETVYK